MRPLRVIFLIFILCIVSCRNDEKIWKPLWDKNHSGLKHAVELIKAEKLNVVTGRSGFQVPDSIDLKEFGQLAFRFSDFEFDSSHTIVFFLAGFHARENPAFVYTNNSKRILEYEKDNVERIDENWYYVSI